MTSLVDGRSTLFVNYYESGVMHYHGFDSRLRAAEELINQHQEQLPQEAAIESLETLKATLDQLIKHRKRWHVQQTCQHDWIEVSEGQQCRRPGCELFVKNGD